MMGAWPADPQDAASRSVRTSAPAGPRTAPPRRRAAAARRPHGQLPRARAGRPAALLARQPADRLLRLRRRARGLPRAPDRGPRQPAVAREGPGAAGGARAPRRSSRRARRSCCARPSSKRLESRETVVLALEGMSAAEREPFVRGRRAQAPAPPDPAGDRARAGARGGPRGAQRAAPGARRRRARRARASRPRCGSAGAPPARSSGSCSARRRAKSLGTRLQRSAMRAIRRCAGVRNSLQRSRRDRSSDRGTQP